MVNLAKGFHLPVPSQFGGLLSPAAFLAAFVCRVLRGALPALGSILLVLELEGILVFACFVASSAICFARASTLLFLALIFSNSALVRVCFVRAISVNSDGIDIILDPLLPFPLPLDIWVFVHMEDMLGYPE